MSLSYIWETREPETSSNSPTLLNLDPASVFLTTELRCLHILLLFPHSTQISRIHLILDIYDSCFPPYILFSLGIMEHCDLWSGKIYWYHNKSILSLQDGGEKLFSENLICTQKYMPWKFKKVFISMFFLL